MLPPADPPAQLVQLGDPVALGVLDQHHRRVGHVDPDLDHRRRDQHVGLPGGEAGHHVELLRGGQLAVHEQHPEVPQLAR